MPAQGSTLAEVDGGPGPAFTIWSARPNEKYQGPKMASYGSWALWPVVESKITAAGTRCAEWAKAPLITTSRPADRG
jgi:hypothetical protein